MKRISIFTAIFLPALIVATTTIQAKYKMPHYAGYSMNMADWTKSSTGTWPGVKDGVTYWYKLDNKGGLWWSTDGKKWAMAKDGTWADKDGKWLKIHDKKLVWSKDGKTWTEVPEWKWEGADGKWYKFDNSWTVWVNSK